MVSFSLVLCKFWKLIDLEKSASLGAFVFLSDFSEPHRNRQRKTPISQEAKDVLRDRLAVEHEFYRQKINLNFWLRNFAGTKKTVPFALVLSNL